MSQTQWKEKNQIIYFFLPSFGVTAYTLISRLEGSYIHIDNNVRRIIDSQIIEPTIKNPGMAIIKGSLFARDERYTSKIIDFAKGQKLSEATIENAIIIRGLFSDEEMKKMGLKQIITMHKPVHLNNHSFLIQSSSSGVGRHLMTCSGKGDAWWTDDVGFLFNGSNLRNFSKFLK